MRSKSTGTCGEDAEDGVSMEKFAGITMKDLYRVETTFQTNVCVYSLVKPDGEDEQSTAELVRRSVNILPRSTSTFTIRISPSFRMRACIVTRTDVGNATRYGHTHGSYVSTRARVREACVESWCIIRLRRYSNDWTTRTSEWVNRCGTTRTEPPLISSVGSIPNNFRLTVLFTGLRVTFR